MSRQLKNAMRLQAERHLLNNLGMPQYGTVTGYDPSRYCVKVTLEPWGDMTGWIPYAAFWVGANWGMFAPPSLGDRVVVTFIDGDRGAGYAESCMFDDTNVPQSVASGEFWLVHKKGQSVKFTNDGKIHLADGNGADIYLDGSGNIQSNALQWNHSGPVKVTGQLEVTGNATFDQNVTVTEILTAEDAQTPGGISLVNHIHPGVQTGGGTTGAPVG